MKDSSLSLVGTFVLLSALYATIGFEELPEMKDAPSVKRPGVTESLFLTLDVGACLPQYDGGMLPSSFVAVRSTARSPEYEGVYLRTMQRSLVNWTFPL